MFIISSRFAYHHTLSHVYPYYNRLHCGATSGKNWFMFTRYIFFHRLPWPSSTGTGTRPHIASGLFLEMATLEKTTSKQLPCVWKSEICQICPQEKKWTISVFGLFAKYDGLFQPQKMVYLPNVSKRDSISVLEGKWWTRGVLCGLAMIFRYQTHMPHPP